jgi:steroid 5-alpha reductase family enzyme
MNGFVILFIVALIVSAIGFKKYVWFISIGYGFSVAAIGLMLLYLYAARADAGLIIACVLFVMYGLRLGGYLTYRETKKASYNKKMKNEIKDGKGMSIVAKCGIWVSAALLYACETSPVLFRLENGNMTDGWVIAGTIIMAAGLVIETSADVQKSLAKRERPGRFVDTGLYTIVRCPNYLGEMTFWTGVFLIGIGSNAGLWQWVAALTGYLGIIYVMFGGARRLEIRQDREYKDDPEYWAYKNRTPIMIPFIPLYSVSKYKWLVA